MRECPSPLQVKTRCRIAYREFYGGSEEAKSITLIFRNILLRMKLSGLQSPTAIFCCSAWSHAHRTSHKDTLPNSITKTTLYSQIFCFFCFFLTVIFLVLNPVLSIKQHFSNERYIPPLEIEFTLFISVISW